MWLPTVLPATGGVLAAMWLAQRSRRMKLAVVIGIVAAVVFAVVAARMVYRCNLPTTSDPENDMRVLLWACSGHETQIAYAFSCVAAPRSIILILVMTIRVALKGKRAKMEA